MNTSSEHEFDCDGSIATSGARVTTTLMAREQRGVYDAAPRPPASPPDDHHRAAPPGAPPSSAELVAQLAATVDALGAVELADEPDEQVCGATLELARQVARAQAQLVALVGEVDARQAYEADGAVSAQSWYRARVNCNPGEASALVNASRRLRGLPQLAAAFAAGHVSLAHTAAVTAAAIPQRMGAIQALETTLVDLARNAQPRDVRTAVACIRDADDPDGSDATPLPDIGPDVRRSLTLRPTIDGLCHLDGLLDPVTGEWLHTLLDAFHTHDPAEVPETQRRSPGQRRHDALHDLLTKVAANPETPQLQGARPHVLVMVDVATLVGVDAQALQTPQLRYAGPITGDLARQLADDARITAVQTMGPWRPVNVGRSQRTLPAWLREAMHMIHRTCRGPDCDRPATWTEAHHVDQWTHHGETDLDRHVPLCVAHHQMVTSGGWDVDYDADTAACTWTSPTGKTLRTHPPPP